MFVCVQSSPCVTFYPGAAFRATSAWPPRWGTKASVRCGEKGSDFIFQRRSAQFGLFIFSLPSFSFLPFSFFPPYTFFGIMFSFLVALISPSKGPLDFIIGTLVRVSCRFWGVGRSSEVLSFEPTIRSALICFSNSVSASSPLRMT